MGVEGYRATGIAAAVVGVIGCAVGCRSIAPPSGEWTLAHVKVDIYTREADLAVPTIAATHGPFRTNVFALSFILAGTTGYVLEVENLTRFPLEFDWKRSLLVDADGWTHPLVYPGAAKSDVYRSESNLPVIIAPYAKRRVVFASRSALCPDEFPFKPGVDPIGLFRRVPSSEQDELLEGLLLVFTFRGEELMYRFEATLKAGGSRGDQDDSEQQSPVREDPN
jgi:hypothetical protein